MTGEAGLPSSFPNLFKEGRHSLPWGAHRIREDEIKQKSFRRLFFWTAGKDFCSLHTSPLPNQSSLISSTPIPASTYAFLSLEIEECGVKSSQEPQFPSFCSMKSWINSGSLIICENRGTDLMITKSLPALNSPFLLHCSFLYKGQSHRDQSWGFQLFCNTQGHSSSRLSSTCQYPQFQMSSSAHISGIN